MINFDFHEIALVPGVAEWLLGIRGKEQENLLICACVVFLSKESAIIYATGLGLYSLGSVSGMRGVSLFVVAITFGTVVVGVP